MQFAGQPKPPVGILFDSAMGNRVDDALALALLYGFDGKNEVRVVALSVTRSNLDAAAFCDAVARFYAGPVSGAFGAFARTLPVGMATDGKIADDPPMLKQPLAKQNPDGKPLYPHGVHHLNDTADPVAVLRNALTAQYDQNAIVVLAGPATNLARMMTLPGVIDLIAHKVRFLSVTADGFSDLAAAQKLFSVWPTPIFVVDKELGEAVLFPAASIEKDFAWSPAHPVADAYRAAKPMPYDAPTLDMAAVLYAARPQEGYFKLSEPGTIQVLDDGKRKFVPSPAGKHRYLISDPEQKDRILKLYTELASAKPVPRQRPIRKPVVQEEKKDPKPADAKP